MNTLTSNYARLYYFNKPGGQGTAWKHNAAHWLLELPFLSREAPYFTNGMFESDCKDLAKLLKEDEHIDLGL